MTLRSGPLLLALDVGTQVGWNAAAEGPGIFTGLTACF